MLPVFHAAGHFNYIKATQIYLQDMTKLQNAMDAEEYMAFTKKGYLPSEERENRGLE